MKIILPLCSIQHDWEIDVDAVVATEASTSLSTTSQTQTPTPSSSFWASCRQTSSSSTIHGTIEVDHSTRSLRGSEGFCIVDKDIPQDASMDCFSLTCDGIEDMTFKFVRSKYSVVDKPAAFRVGDYSPSGALFVCGGSHGKVVVYETKTMKQLRVLEGPKGLVNSCKFFPSGEVIITGGSDCRARVFSAVDGRNPVTFLHSGAVNGISILERGRNVLTCSEDKHVRVWDCGTEKALYDFACIDRVSHISLLKYTTEKASSRTPHEREVGTMDKVVVAAANRILVGIDLRTQSQAFQIQQQVSTTALCSIDNHLFASGNKIGTVNVWDVRNPKIPVLEVLRHEAEISSLCHVGDGKLLTGTSDGMCTMFETTPSMNPTSSIEITELTGSNLDPISQIFTTTRKNWVGACCPNDGHVRFYPIVTDSK
eukprot:m.24859 g.24859  ORF g.24859 m.24859 type:complete len:426 (+) comp5702_c0_seq1:76-1353(+)